MSEGSGTMKKKVASWLMEEHFTLSEKSDPKTYFNLAVERGRFVGTVAAPKASEGIIVGGGMNLAPQAISAYQALEDERKKACLDDLIMYLLSNPSISEWHVGPKPLSEFTLVRWVSKPLFADTITKESLISTISDLYKAMAGVETILSKHTGTIAPGRADSGASFYG